MPLMNIFPQLARNLLMRSPRKLTATKVVLNILTSLTKDSVLLRQIAVKYFHYWINLANQNKATGLDKISARLIRECADLICISICKIFNCSLTTGIFPDDWKCAIVTPLFKQGSSSDMNNYRPISVISVVAKVFERITYDRVYAYLWEHSIISKSQSDFRSIHCTVTALLEATDSWTFDIDRGNVNAVVFLDLNKAFDTVDHMILLSKLSTYGIQENAYNWFKSYLENRTQICSVSVSLSQTCSLKCGIPQGTILGPILF